MKSDFIIVAPFQTQKYLDIKEETSNQPAVKVAKYEPTLPNILYNKNTF